MRYIDILEAFETEIGVINKTEKPLTTDSLFWLNQAVDKFVKLRFNTDLVHRTSYEQNEKRRNDLINLYVTKKWTINDPTSRVSVNDTNPQYDKYTISYPDDFLFSLNEDVIITDLKGQNPYSTSIFECTSDSFMYRVTNSLTDFHYKYGQARPLRVRTDSGCYLLTDKKYLIKEYVLGYLRNPKKITLDQPFEEYGDFDDITIPEIVKIAAQMYLENLGNPRYKTITQEVMTQE